MNEIKKSKDGTHTYTVGCAPDVPDKQIESWLKDLFLQVNAAACAAGGEYMKLWEHLKHDAWEFDYGRCIESIRDLEKMGVRAPADEGEVKALRHALVQLHIAHAACGIGCLRYIK